MQKAENSDFFWQVATKIPKDKSVVTEEFMVKSGAIGSFELLYEEGKTDNLNADDTMMYFFFASDFPVRAFIPMALAALGLENAEARVETIRYEDYIKIFESTFRSFPLTEKFMLCPPWDIPDEQTGVKRLILKPGLAFGTGKHETTRLMIRFLENKLHPGMSLYDLGTGSGILAIAGAILGAVKITGVDVETMAVDSAAENYRLNLDFHPLTTEFHFARGDFQFRPDFHPDIFLANILPNIFYQNEKNLADLIRNCRYWALSGIPDAAIKEFLIWIEKISGKTPEVLEDSGWYCVSGKGEL